jgi:hypothetical protein
MRAPLHSSLYSVKQAKRRLQEFEAKATAFEQSYPYARFVEPNADGTKDVYKLKITEPIPEDLPGIAFEVLNHLRSSLDQAGSFIARASNPGKSQRVRGAFPFGKTPESVADKRRSDSKHLPEEIFDLMAGFKPYEGGDRLLWAMNSYRATHQHDLLIPVGLAVSSMDFSFDYPGEVFDFAIPPQWDAAKEEMVFFSVLRGAPEPNYHFKMLVLVAIGEIEGLRREPAVAVFNGMVGKVESILVALEAESRRLGLFAISVSLAALTHGGLAAVVRQVYYCQVS